MFLEAVAAMRALLVADATLLAAMASRWYLDINPADGDSVVYPYGILADNASGTGYASKSTALDDMRLLVKVVGTSQSATYALGAAIRAALNGQTVVVGSGLYAYHRIEQIGVVNYTEKDAETLFTHSGGIYRLRMSE